jgi:hypothetical protein
MRTKNDRLALARLRSAVVLPAALAPLLLLPAPALGQVSGDPEAGTLDGSPLDDLPPYIRVLTNFGARPDWSPKGDRLVFIESAPLGEVFEVEVTTGATRKLTGGFEHIGFSRAQYLPTGDLLLCGPTSGPRPSAENPEAGRFTGVLSVLRAPFNGVPAPLGIPCWEAMATSNDSLRITWNRSDIDYTDPDVISRVVNGVSEIWTGELRYERDRVWVENVALVMDRTAVSSIAVLEVQDFRPGTDDLIFSAFAYQGSEVMGVDLQTGAVTNYSNSPVFEEAHGVAPSGAWVLAGRNLNSTALPGPVDIWLLPLDGSEAWDRLTRFNRYRGWYASNPEVSPDGTQFAFMVAFDGEVVGEGRGILLFDLAASGRPTAPPDPAAAPSVSPDSAGCSMGKSPVQRNAVWYWMALAGWLVARRAQSRERA